MLLAYCGLCRAYWDLITWDKRRQSVEVVENVIDEKPICEFSADARWTVDTAYTAVLGVLHESAHRCELYWDNETALVARTALEDAENHFCNLLRDIYGSPFRPTTLDTAWLTSEVVVLAQTIYDNRAFGRLPELADALEQAGCTDADVLDHCRQPGEHVRGCWVVDLVLGKE
jgi:hypothetical protein